MGVQTAQALLAACGIYLLCGVGFASWFMVRGLERLDPAARGSGWGFRALIAPGIVALWPIIAAKVFRVHAPAGKARSPGAASEHYS